MELKIYNELNSEQKTLSVSSSSTLGEVYDILCNEDPSLVHQQCLFRYRGILLKFHQSLQDIAIFHGFHENHWLRLAKVELKEDSPPSNLEVRSRGISMDLIEEFSKSQTLEVPVEIELPEIAVKKWLAIQQQTLQKQQQKWHYGLLTQAVADDTPQVGKLFAENYQILEQIGESDIEIAFRALDLQQQRHCMLLVAPDRCVELTEMDFFHTATLQTFATGRHGGYVFLSTEYQDIVNLHQILERRLPVSDLVEMVTRLARIIAEFHQQNYFHGDLRPGNIWVDRQLYPFLLLGLRVKLCNAVKIDKNAPPHGLCFTLKRPYIYTSKRILDGSPADAASDVFSLAAILYYLVSGKPPFGSHKTSVVVAELLNRERCIPSIPKSLFQIIAGALQGFIGIDSFITELEKWLMRAKANQLQQDIEVQGLAPLVWLRFSGFLQSTHQECWQHLLPLLKTHLGNNAINQHCYNFLDAFLHEQDPQKIYAKLLAISDYTLKMLWLERMILVKPIVSKFIAKLGLAKVKALMRRGNSLVRKAIVESLIRHSLEDSLDYLLDILTEGHWGVEEIILQSFRKLRKFLVGPLLISLYGSPKMRAKKANEVLSELGFATLAEGLEALANNDAQPWSKTIVEINKIKTQWSIATSLVMLTADEDRHTRKLASAALSIFGPRPLLKKCLDDVIEYRSEVYQILRFVNGVGREIAQIGLTSLKEHFSQKFCDKIVELRWGEPQERIQAARWLGKKRSACAVVFLLEALYDPQEDLQKMAKLSLVQIGAPGVAEIVKHLHEPKLREVLEEILVTIGKLAIPSLTACLQSTVDINKRCIIAEVLGKIGGEKAIQALLLLFAAKDLHLHNTAKKQLVAQKLLAEEMMLERIKGSPQVRLSAQEVLAGMHSPRVVPSLLADLERNSPQIRKAAADILAKMSLSLSKPYLEKASPSVLFKVIALVPNPQLRQCVREVLPADKQEVGKWIEQLHWQKSLEVFTNLDKNIDRTLVPSLIYALEDEDLIFSLAAAATLTQFPTIDIAKALVFRWRDLWRETIANLLYNGMIDVYTVADIQETRELSFFRQYIQKLGDLSITFLLQIIETELPLLALRAIEIIDDIASFKAVSTMREILKETDDNFISRAIQIVLVGERGDSLTSKVLELENSPDFKGFIAQAMKSRKGKLLEALQNGDPKNRKKAMVLAAELHINEAVTYMIQSLAMKDQELRETAVASLGELGDTAAVPPLIAILSYESEGMRKKVCEALVKIGDNSVVPALIMKLSEKDPKLRAMCVWTLGHMQDVQAIPHLLSRLDDPDANVRYNCLVALGKLRSSTGISPLIEMLEDPNPGVQLQTAIFLAQMADQQALAALQQAIEKMSMQGDAASQFICKKFREAIDKIQR